MISLFFAIALFFLFAVSKNVFISTLILCLTTFVMAFLMFHTLSSWLSLVLVLVYIGGMSVLFLYMSALASSQKIVFPGVYPYLMLHLILLWLYSETLSPLLTKNSALFLSELSLKGNTGLLVLTAYLGLLMLATMELLKDNRMAMKSYVSKF